MSLILFELLSVHKRLHICHRVTLKHFLDISVPLIYLFRFVTMTVNGHLNQSGHFAVINTAASISHNTIIVQ